MGQEDLWIVTVLEKGIVTQRFLVKGSEEERDRIKALFEEYFHNETEAVHITKFNWTETIEDFKVYQMF